jgi:hypothetical protein
MSNFELFMSFFGLLLGLAVAELMSGFANLARAKDRPRIGVITPVLGVFIFLSIMVSLLDAFRKLQDVPVSLIGFALPTLIGIAHFVAAVATVPREQGSWESLDDYFFRAAHLDGRDAAGGNRAYNRDRASLHHRDDPGRRMGQVCRLCRIELVLVGSTCRDPDGTQSVGGGGRVRAAHRAEPLLLWRVRRGFLPSDEQPEQLT